MGMHYSARMNIQMAIFACTSTGDLMEPSAYDDQDLLCRTCQLITAIVSASSSGIQLLLGRDLLGKLKIPLEDYRCNAMASCPQQASEWDDAEDGCDSYPSLPAVEAVLDALEVKIASQNCSTFVLDKSATRMYANLDLAVGQRLHMGGHWTLWRP